MCLNPVRLAHAARRGLVLADGDLEGNNALQRQLRNGAAIAPVNQSAWQMKQNIQQPCRFLPVAAQQLGQKPGDFFANAFDCGHISK